MSANECSDGRAEGTRGMEFKRLYTGKDEKRNDGDQRKTPVFTTGTNKMFNEKEIHT